MFPPLANPPRVVSGFEALSMMGFPRDLLCRFLASNTVEGKNLDAFFHNMAGNTFPGAVTFAFLLSILFHLREEHVRAHLRASSARAPHGGEDVAALLLS